MKAIFWETYETLFALDAFGNYWRENEKLISKAADEVEEANRPDWLPENESERGEYHMHLRYARELHDEIMTPMFRYSCIVMLYAIIERELHRLVNNLEKDRGIQKLKFKDIRASSFLSQVAKFTEVFFALPLAKCPHYQALTDLQKIRDCIVHCRGEIDLVGSEKDRTYLRRLKDIRSGVFGMGQAAIEIPAISIERFIGEAQRFFNWVFNQLNWEIDDLWLQNNP